MSTPESDHPYRPWAGWLAAAPLAYVVTFAIVPTIVLIRRVGSFDQVGDVLTKQSVRDALWFSTWQAALSVVVCLVVALPVTWVLARFDFPARRVVLAVVTTPFLLPTVVVGVAILAALPDRLDYTWVGVVVAHAYFNVAVVVRVVGARWESLSPGLAAAAQTLGATRPKAMTTVVVPALRPALLTASLVVGLFCFTSFGVVRMVGGPSLSTIETEIYTQAVLIGELDSAVVLAVLQVAFLVGVGLLMSRRDATVRRVDRFVVRRRLLHTDPLRPAVAAIVGVTLVLVTAPWIATFSRSVGGWGFVRTETFRDALRTSVRTAVVCAVLATVLGTASALAATYSTKWSFVGGATSALPLTISAVVIGLGYLLTFDTAPFDFRASWFITPLAHTLIAMPLVHVVVTQAARSIPRDVSAAAMTLGAHRLRAWSTVDAPLLRRSIVSAAALSAAVSLGEFGAASFLSRRESTSLPVLIAREMGRPGDVRTAQAYVVASLFIVVAIGVLVIVESHQGRRS